MMRHEITALTLVYVYSIGGFTSIPWVRPPPTIHCISFSGRQYCSFAADLIHQEYNARPLTPGSVLADGDVVMSDELNNDPPAASEVALVRRKMPSLPPVPVATR